MLGLVHALSGFKHVKSPKLTKIRESVSLGLCSRHPSSLGQCQTFILQKPKNSQREGARLPSLDVSLWCIIQRNQTTAANRGISKPRVSEIYGRKSLWLKFQSGSICAWLAPTLEDCVFSLSTNVMLHTILQRNLLLWSCWQAKASEEHCSGLKLTCKCSFHTGLDVLSCVHTHFINDTQMRDRSGKILD